MPDDFVDEFSSSRREALKFAAASLTLLVTPLGVHGAQAASIIGVRVWPAADYTRVTLEYDREIKYTQLQLRNPDRMVVDLEGVELDSVLQSLPEKVSETDPYIKLIRAGRNKPGVVRLVIELKGEVKPQMFSLAPVGEYGHRLVLDLYPLQAADPLMALLDKRPVVPPFDAPAAELPQDKPPGSELPQAEQNPNRPPQNTNRDKVRSRA